MKKVLLFFVLGVFTTSISHASNGSENTEKADSASLVAEQPTLVVHGATVYKDGVRLEPTEVVKILADYPKIAAQYSKGTSLRSTGNVLIFGGVLSMVGGMALMVDALNTYSQEATYNNTEQTPPDGYFTGLFITTIGGLMIDGAIACKIVGKVQIRKSVRNYNNAISTSSFNYNPRAVQYQLGLLNNGQIGFRLSF